MIEPTGTYISHLVEVSEEVAIRHDALKYAITMSDCHNSDDALNIARKFTIFIEKGEVTHSRVNN